MSRRSIKSPKVLILTPLVMVLFFALACGTAAPAEPVIVEKEVIKEVIKEVPVEKIVVREVIKEVVKQSEVMTKAEGGVGKAPPTIVPGVAVAADVMAPARAIPTGR